jgi:hypothetical protein
LKNLTKEEIFVSLNFWEEAKMGNNEENSIHTELMEKLLRIFKIEKLDIKSLEGTVDLCLVFSMLKDKGVISNSEWESYQLIANKK